MKAYGSQIFLNAEELPQSLEISKDYYSLQQICTGYIKQVSPIYCINLSLFKKPLHIFSYYDML